MISAMTDYQYNSIIEMVDIILEGSRDIDEARQKIEEQKAEVTTVMKKAGVSEPRNLEEQALMLIDKYNGSRKENDEKEQN